jgi:stage III sporulation protein AC
MDVSLILKIAGLGILVSVTCQILNKSGRDEQSMMVSVAGIIIVALLLLGEIQNLFEMLRSVFGF